MSTTHRAEGTSRRRGRAVAERHATTSAAARQSRRQERQRGAAGSGAVSAARQRPPPERKRPRERQHAELRAAEHETPRCESEPPPRKSSERASRRRERGGTTKPAPGAPARCCRPRRRERRAMAIADREKATTPTNTRRKHEPLSKMHRAGSVSRRHGKSVAERHAAASASTRLSRRQECQRGAVGSGAVGAVRRRLPPERKRPHQRPQQRARITVHYALRQESKLPL